MIEALPTVVHHINTPGWRLTDQGESRGYIQPQLLQELWFHTGTRCNLQCPFCFEGSGPGNDRLDPLTLADVQPFIREAVALGTSQFSFTGGEPFMNREMLDILDFALDFGPCLLLSNATAPLARQLDHLKPLLQKKYPLSFRVSLDSPSPEAHDQNRGIGNFQLALQTMGKLHALGFKVSVARQHQPGEVQHRVEQAYRPYLQEVGLPKTTPIISFPNLFPPGASPQVPQITETCMTTYKTQRDREQLMCNYSKMVAKKAGQMQVYACTLVDDDEDYNLAPSLETAMPIRVMLRHHRCFGCFSSGTSCSEGLS